MKINSFSSLAILIGTIVGAGILGLPYVFAKASFLTGLLTSTVVAVIVLFLYLYMGEIVARTKGKHQLTGYSKIYLGEFGKNLMLISMIIGGYGALTAYLLGIGQSFVAIFGGSKLFYMLAFFVIFSFLIFKGLKIIAGSEVFTVLSFLIILFLVMIFCVPFFSISNVAHFNFSKFFIPFGPVLFAFLGFAAVPEAFQNLSHKKDFKDVLILSILIPFGLYLLFSFFSIGALGSKFLGLVGDSRIATVALSNFINPSIAILGNFFAIFAMSSSFITIGLALKQVWNYDYGFSENLSSIFTLVPPLIIVLLGITNFIQIISIVGVIAGTIDTFLIILMINKAKKIGSRIPEFSIPFSKFLGFILFGLFLFGGVYFLVSLV